MQMRLVVVGMVIASTAEAKPLPRGLKVVVKNGQALVQQGAVSVPLRDDELVDYETIAKAELSADGKTLVVTATRCSGTLVDDVTQVPLVKVQARIDAELGRLALGKKRHAEAIAKLTSAVQKDPDTPAYATSLLAAQIAAKKLDQAGQTIAVHGKKNPAWFAYQIAVDPALAAARDHKRAADLRAATPGTATSEQLRANDLALSPLGGGIAVVRGGAVAVARPGVERRESTSELELVSLATGKLLARIPIETGEDACEDKTDVACNDAATARINARTQTANALLAALGFTIHKHALVDVRNGDPVSRDGVDVELEDHAVTASRGGADRRLEIDGQPWQVGFTPSALVVRYVRHNVSACNDASTRYSGAAIPLP